MRLVSIIGIHSLIAHFVGVAAGVIAGFHGFHVKNGSTFLGTSPAVTGMPHAFPAKYCCCTRMNHRGLTNVSVISTSTTTAEAVEGPR